MMCLMGTHSSSSYQNKRVHLNLSETVLKKYCLHITSRRNMASKVLIFASVFLFLCVVTHGEASPHRSKRGFRSYFRNYLDEMAMSVCASIPTDGPGHIYAVRRKCGEAVNCRQICTGSTFRNSAGAKTAKLGCTESLHVYKKQPLLADNFDADTDVHKAGPVIYRYHTCEHGGCGPNYCCCIRQ